METINSLITSILQIIFFCLLLFNIRKKPIQVWNDVNDQNRTFSFTVPGWWNELPTPMQNAESLTMFKRHLKTHLFRHHLTSFKKKKTLTFLNFALFPLTSHCLARICSEQCLDMCITSTSCVCLPLYNVSLIVFLNCKSLWIKASAKWMMTKFSFLCELFL